MDITWDLVAKIAGILIWIIILANFIHAYLYTTNPKSRPDILAGALFYTIICSIFAMIFLGTPAASHELTHPERLRTSIAVLYVLIAVIAYLLAKAKARRQHA